ncbi:hypothetical protein Leryth_027292 [Lithospermum erythrorhizon]|nr:hypothetical protein Leryth_027292 [Lithospermum erythrorhizon]
MGFPSSKPNLLFIALIMVIGFACNQESKVFIQARPLLVKQETEKETIHRNTLFATLGLVCKCCDDATKGDGECVSTWKGTCSDIKCSPWKSHSL